MMKFDETDKFKRDFKKLSKRFMSLKDDLIVLKNSAINLYHLAGIDSRAIFEIEGVGNTPERSFYKVKKFACKSLKGRGAQSGIRVIYAYYAEQQRVVFIEIYFKGDKKIEDRGRFGLF